MGKRGPAKKPTQLRVLEGNRGHQKKNKKEPSPDPKIPTCPKQLGRSAKAEWRRVAPAMYKLGLLTQVDRAAMAAYCDAYGRWIDAQTEIKEHGTIIESQNGFPIQSPYLNVASGAWKQMLAALREFGMTPASRASIEADPVDPMEDLEDIVGG